MILIQTNSVPFDLDDLKTDFRVQMRPNNVKYVSYFWHRQLSKVFKLLFIYYILLYVDNSRRIWSIVWFVVLQLHHRQSNIRSVSDVISKPRYHYCHNFCALNEQSEVIEALNTHSFETLTQQLKGMDYNQSKSDPILNPQNTCTVKPV